MKFRTDRDDTTHTRGIGCFDPHCTRNEHYPTALVDMGHVQERLKTDQSLWGIWQIHRMADGRVRVLPRGLDDQWTDSERKVLSLLDQETKQRLKPILSFGPWWFVVEMAQRVAEIHSATPLRDRITESAWTNSGLVGEETK